MLPSWRKMQKDAPAPSESPSVRRLNEAVAKQSAQLKLLAQKEKLEGTPAEAPKMSLILTDEELQAKLAPVEEEEEGVEEVDPRRESDPKLLSKRLRRKSGVDASTFDRRESAEG